MRGAAAAALSTLALASGCGGGDGDDGTRADTTTRTPPRAAPAAGGGGECVDAPKADSAARAREKPQEKLETAKTYRLEFVTNCGEFTVTLDPETAPNTAASLVALAESGFYDGTPIHRIVPGFVIQGGDPTGTGTGGPGYSTRDAPPSNARYVKGVVAMAKTQTEPPGTSGSQFFVVTGADIGLPPEYAIVGRVTEGLDVVERIGRLGDALEQPTRPVVITDVAVAVAVS